jgi:hypothetical protein
MNRRPASRHVWWARNAEGGAEGKDRLCLVLEVVGDYVRVIYGQSKPGSRDIPIRLGTNDGRRFGVTKDTYFRATNERILKTSDLIRYAGACSQDMFLEFQEMLDIFHAASVPVPVPAPNDSGLTAEAVEDNAAECEHDASPTPAAD